MVDCHVPTVAQKGQTFYIVARFADHNSLSYILGRVGGEVRGSQLVTIYILTTRRY